MLAANGRQCAGDAAPRWHLYVLLRNRFSGLQIFGGPCARARPPPCPCGGWGHVAARGHAPSQNRLHDAAIAWPSHGRRSAAGPSMRDLRPHFAEPTSRYLWRALSLLQACPGAPPTSRCTTSIPTPARLSKPFYADQVLARSFGRRVGWCWWTCRVLGRPLSILTNDVAGCSGWA